MNCGGARRQVDLCYVIPDTLGKAGLSDADCLVSSLHVDQVLLCPCETNPVAQPPGELAGCWALEQEGRAGSWDRQA